jgi:predicted DNA-binding transcriptional regulator AlpA
VSTTGVTPALFRIAGAVEYTGQSESTIRRAVHATDPTAFPPPLKAKKQGTHPKAPLQFLRRELDAWLEQFPDA